LSKHGPDREKNKKNKEEEKEGNEWNKKQPTRSDKKGRNFLLPLTLCASIIRANRK
jgi:hypothetical protein